LVPPTDTKEEEVRASPERLLYPYDPELEQ